MNDEDPYTPPKASSLLRESDRVGSKVSRDKPLEMEFLPLLTSFSGRIGRRQFLRWYLPFWLLPLGFLLLTPVIALVSSFLALYPLFALSTKRYHDLGSNGWFGLFQLIPFVGALFVLAECGFSIGEFHDNRFGRSIYRK